jgi:xanthine dehydrogenase YagS FAD-binding subunit
MKPFHLKNVSSIAQALDAAHTVVDNPQSGMSMSFLAGGTTLLDLMKLNVEQPNQVIDIHRLPLDQVEAHDSGGVIIGAMVRNSDLANDPLIKTLSCPLPSTAFRCISPVTKHGDDRR